MSFPIFPDDPGMILKHWKNEILRVILRGRHSFCVVVVFVCLFFLFDTFEKKIPYFSIYYLRIIIIQHNRVVAIEIYVA